jgi:hypothetical protein
MWGRMERQRRQAVEEERGGKRMVMGEEKHAIICHSRRLAERAGGREI